MPTVERQTQVRDVALRKLRDVTVAVALAAAARVGLIAWVSAATIPGSTATSGLTGNAATGDGEQVISNNPSGFDEREVLQLATHLATPQQARDAYQLALALGPLPGWQREAIDQRYSLIHEALAHPELTGGEATNLAAARRLAAQRLLDEIPAIERMRFAPTS